MSDWKRTYRVVYVANLVTAVGMMSFLPFFPSYLEELGLRDRDEIETWTGLVFGAAPFVAAFMGPVWGALGDRIGRKLMIVRAMCAIMLFVGAMGFVTAPWQLLVLRIMQGVFSGFVPPSITLVSVAAPREQQGRIAGALQSSLAAGSVIGPLVGTGIQHWLGARAVFWFVSLAAGLAVLGVILFAREDSQLRVRPEQAARRSALRGFGSDMKELLKEPALRGVLLLLFVVQFGLGASNPLMELYVRDLWGGDAERARTVTGVLFAVFAVAVWFATQWWGRFGDRRGHGLALEIATGLTGLVLLLHGAVPHIALLVFLRILLGLTVSGPQANSFGMAGADTKPEQRGGAFGLVFGVRALAVSIGAMSSGMIASLIGIRGLFVLAGCVICVVLATHKRRAIRTR